MCPGEGEMRAMGREGGRKKELTTTLTQAKGGAARPFHWPFLGQCASNLYACRSQRMINDQQGPGPFSNGSRVEERAHEERKGGGGGKQNKKDASRAQTRRGSRNSTWR